jgi:hypothetical protein
VAKLTQFEINSFKKVIHMKLQKNILSHLIGRIVLAAAAV